MPGNLADFLSVNPVIGRRRQLSLALRQLESTRLITIVGAGGVGKTSFAMELAKAARRMAPDGVRVLPLGRTPDVDDAVAARFPGTLDSADALVLRLGDQRAILVVDNCEHVLRAARALIDTVLRRCPRLRVIATSRTVLAMEGEVQHRLPPLATAAETDRPSTTLSPAAQLFLQRARAISPTMTLDTGIVEAICRKLDGLPLAIELAAPRLSVLSPEELLERLGSPLPLLVRPTLDQDVKHATLANSISWSYDLLSDDERVLWRHLSVFVAPFQLPAIESVCRRVLPTSTSPLDLTHSLVAKSMLVRRDDDVGVWFSLLIPLRSFGRERLESQGETDSAHDAHFAWCAALVAGAEAEWETPQQRTWRTAVSRAIPDIQVALDYALKHRGHHRAALDLLLPIWAPLWSTRGRLAELLAMLERALTGIDGVIDDRVVEAHILRAYLLGLTQGPVAADPAHRAAEKLVDDSGYPDGRIFLDISRATLMPDAHEAIRLYEQVLPRARAVPRIMMQTRLLTRVALLHDGLGNLARADELTEEIESAAEQSGATLDLAYVMYGRGVNAYARGDLEQATAFSRRCIELTRHGLVNNDTVHSLETLAAVLAATGEHEQAARMLGVADSVRANLDVLDGSLLQRPVDRAAVEQSVRSALGDDAFEHAVALSRDVPWSDALGEVLGEPPRATRAAREPSDGLTAREHEVRDLMAQGLTNREIAGRLNLSVRTVEGHAQNVLLKLGHSSRKQLIAATRSVPNDI